MAIDPLRDQFQSFSKSLQALSRRVRRLEVKEVPNPTPGTGGIGDMLKSVYDVNNNGIVDDSEDSQGLEGHPASYFATSVHTHALLHDPATVADTSTVDMSITGQQISADVIPGGIKLDDLGTPDDNTDLNATITYHGLLPKLTGNDYEVLRGDGSWGNVSDTGGGDITWHIDGALVAAASVGPFYVVPRLSTIQAVYIYCETTGTSGSTIVDVNRNGTTIFTTQANRPTLAFNDVDKLVKSGTPDITSLSEYDVLSVDIDQVAAGAANLTVVVALGSTGVQYAHIPRMIYYFVPGGLVIGDDGIRITNELGYNVDIDKVSLRSKSTISGTVTLDVHKDGTTIFTNQANRPSITNGNTYGFTTSIDVPAWLSDEVLTFEWDAASGSDVTIEVLFH